MRKWKSVHVTKPARIIDPHPYQGMNDERPRKFIIIDQLSGQVVQVRGVSLRFALDNLNWHIESVTYNDLGPSKPGEPEYMSLTGWSPIQEPLHSIYAKRKVR